MLNQLSHRPIIVIEDSDEDFEVTVWALRKAGAVNPVHRCANAAAIAELWTGRPNWPTALSGPYPLLVLMDLNIPGVDWTEILDHLRASPWWQAVPVVVISTSDQPSTVSACYSEGVAGYLKKSVDLATFAETISGFAAYWLKTVVPPQPNEERSLGVLSGKSSPAHIARTLSSMRRNRIAGLV
jgi:CheY-like chemotaxis protein